MRHLKFCCLMLISILFLVACEEEPVELYKASGAIKEVDCTITSKSITLDNGVNYYGGNLNCGINIGTEVTIIHDERFIVHEFLAEGTEKLENKSN